MSDSPLPPTLNEELTTLLHAAVARHALSSEQVRFGFSFSVLATAQGQPAIVTVVVLSLPGLLLGQPVSTGLVIDTPVPTAAQVEDYVRHALEELRRQRAEQTKLALPGDLLHD